MKSLLLMLMLFSSVSAWAQDFGHDFALPCMVGPEVSEKKAVIRQIVDRYQTQSRARFGDEVQIRFMEDAAHCEEINMTAGIDERRNRPGIFVYHGFLEMMNIEGVVAATCHELGHFFGEITRGQAGETGRPVELAMAVEGEADYFAGSCLAEYYGSTTQSIESGRKLYGGLHSDLVINEDLARGQSFKLKLGIDTDYPNPHCRMLSFIAGALGEPRPACWYNPR